MLKGSLKPFLARGKILPCSRYAANLSDKPPARAKSSVTIFTFKGSLKMNKPIFRLPHLFLSPSHDRISGLSTAPKGCL